MSAVIRQMVLRKRLINDQVRADILARDAIITKAKGATGPAGEDGRGIEKVSVVKGDLIVTYTDGKKQNVGNVTSEKVVIVAGGSSGASSAPIVEEVAMYAKRVDFINDNLFYKAEALPGSSIVDAVWRISRTTIGVDGDVTEEWANGSALFGYVWNDRLTFNYS